MDRKERLNDPEEAFRVALDGRQSQIWTAIPAIVQDVDLSKMVVSAQPSVKGVVTQVDGSLRYVNLPLLIYVPILFPRGGGFTITFPIKKNDEVLIIFSSRCIDGWWQNGGVQVPMEARMHDLSDGFALLAPTSQPKVISNISDEDIQIRTDDGNSYISLSTDGKIKIVAPDDVEITGNLKITGNIEATGNLSVNGSISSTGDIESSGDVVASKGATDISLSGHVHSGVTTGSGDSGPPK